MRVIVRDDNEVAFDIDTASGEVATVPAKVASVICALIWALTQTTEYLLDETGQGARP
jgi:hypothetical protein